MSGTEAIDTALRLYQRSAWKTLAWTAVPMAYCFAALVFVAIVVLPGLFTTRSTGAFAAEISEIVLALGFGVLVAVPLFSLGLGLAVGTTVQTASDMLHGMEPDETRAKAAARTSLRAVLSGLFATVAQALGLVLAGGLFALLAMFLEGSGVLGPAGGPLASIASVMLLMLGIPVAPLLLTTRVLTPVVAVLEGGRSGNVVRRSKNLMRYHRGQGMAGSVVLGTTALVLLVGGTLWPTLGLLLELTGLPARAEAWNPVPGAGQFLHGVVSLLPAYVTLWLLAPLFATAMTVLYYDRVVRLEAYDIRLMHDEISRTDRRAVLLR